MNYNGHIKIYLIYIQSFWDFIRISAKSQSYSIFFGFNYDLTIEICREVDFNH